MNEVREIMRELGKIHAQLEVLADETKPDFVRFSQAKDSVLDAIEKLANITP